MSSLYIQTWQDCYQGGNISDKKATIDKPIAVLGGGPSLPLDLAILYDTFRDNIVYMAINHHAQRIIPVDFMAFLDKPEYIKDFEIKLGFVDAIGDESTINITTHVDKANVYIDIPYWDDVESTSLAAIWAACWMGTKAVYLCGMNLFMTRPAYFYKWEGGYFPGQLEYKRSIYRKAFDTCEDPGRIRAISGPLTAVFK